MVKQIQITLEETSFGKVWSASGLAMKEELSISIFFRVYAVVVAHGLVKNVIIRKVLLDFI